MSRTDRLIDSFVEKVNSSPREPLWPEDVPFEVRLGLPSEDNWCDWQIRRFNTIDWITPFEEVSPVRLPPAFRSLVTRYIYPELEIGDLCLLANTGEDIPHEWRSVVRVGDMKDHLTQTLIARGYVQFARPFEGINYDALCFDTNCRSGSGEYPIVWLDHEAILCFNKIHVVRKFAASFTEIIEDYVNGGPGLKL